MGKIRQIRAARAELKQAKRALDDNYAKDMAAGVREETDTYLALNARVNESLERLPWYAR